MHKQVDESIKYLKDDLLDILNCSKLKDGEVVTSNRGTVLQLELTAEKIVKFFNSRL